MVSIVRGGEMSYPVDINSLPAGRDSGGIIAIVAKNIRDLRVYYGLSQQDLADIMKSHKSSVSKIEKGAWNPTIEMLSEYAEALAVALPLLLMDKPEHVLLKDASGKICKWPIDNHKR